MLLCAILWSQVFLSFYVQTSKANPRTITVPTNYPTISEALNYAMDGDTILVLNGTYPEGNLLITKALSLVGENAESTIVVANITATAGTTISDITLRGVLALGGGNLVIKNNTILGYGQGGYSWYGACGIHVYGSGGYDGNNSITHNRIEGWSDWAIDVFRSRNNTITDNTILNCSGGINLHSGSGFQHLRNNIITNCDEPFVMQSNEFEDCLQDIDTSNLINGKAICYLASTSNITVDQEGFPSVGYLGIFNSSNLVVKGLNLPLVTFQVMYSVNITLGQNSLGNVDLLGSNRTVISECTLSKLSVCVSSYLMISGNELEQLAISGWGWGRSNNVTVCGNRIQGSKYFGLAMSDGDNCTFEGNNVTENEFGMIIDGEYNGFQSCIIARNNIARNEVGLVLGDVHNATIKGNRLEQNGIGLELDEQVSGNRIYLNNFCGNEQQLKIDPTSTLNFWDDGLQGNYWSDYNGTDTNGDGIGETNIPHQKVDWLPIMGSTDQIDLTLDGAPYEVDIASNSTVSNFQYGGDRINFDVSGQNGTVGFCRICIPIALLNGTYRVFVNGIEVLYNPLPCSNSTHSYLYFTYDHSTQEVVIIPEFPSFLILPLLMIMTLLAAIAHRRNQT